MKKFIYLIVAIVILGLIVPGCIPVVPPTEEDESSNLTKGSSIPIILTLSSNESETKQAGWTTTDPILDPLNPNLYSGIDSWSAAFFVTPHSAWYPPFDTSKWVSTASTLESGNGDSWRLFKAEFNIPTGAIICSAKLWITADNAVVAYLNDKGHEVYTTTDVYGLSPSLMPWYFANLYGPFDFIPLEGTNNLYFVVRNWGISSFNPVGLLYNAEIEYTMPLEVPLDIKPQSCPNPFNVKSKGVLPVAILGTEGFDVTLVDPVSIRLEGVAPLRWDLEDVAIPFVPYTGKSDCELDCNILGPDGELDLTLKFDTQEVAAALGVVGDGECLTLTLTGELFDGTPIVGEDVIFIIKKGK